MSTYQKTIRAAYLDQAKTIEKGSEPDQFLKWLRFNLIHYFEYILKKGLPKPNKEFEIPEGHWAKPLDNLRLKYDKISIHYANLYRGGYIFNYLGFAVAIIIASSAFTVLYYKEGINVNVGSTHAADFLLLLLGIMKLIVIMLIIYNSHDLKDNNINAKYIDFRFVSERIRFFVAYAFLGKECKLQPVSGGHLEKLLKENTGFLLYKEIEKVEVVQLVNKLDPKNVDKQAAFDYLIKNQFEFHDSRRQRHRKYESKLKQLAEFLNTTVKWLVIADMVIAICYLSCYYWKSVVEQSIAAKLAQHYSEIIHHATPILVILTIIIPAFVAAIVAITAQSEYGKLAARNERLSLELIEFVNKYENQLEEDRKNNQNNGTPTSNKAELYFDSNFENMAQKLLDEVTEWTLIYEKEVHEM